jgi:hypothetical protein
MPMATLKYPRTLNKAGKVFVKGVSVPISNEVAALLNNDARFTIKGFDDPTEPGSARSVPGVSSGRPFVRAVRLEHIRNANDTLDPDVTENYDITGKPSIAGLEKAMGWRPDQGEIDEALNVRKRIGGAEARSALAQRHREQITGEAIGRAPEPPRGKQPIISAPVVEEVGGEEEGEELIEKPSKVPVVAVSETTSRFTKDPVDDNAAAQLTTAELNALPPSTYPPNVAVIKAARVKVKSPPGETAPEKTLPVD